MKLAKFVCKILGACLIVAGFACLIVGFWDHLSTCFGQSRCFGDKIIAKVKRPAEYDDFADV